MPETPESRDAPRSEDLRAPGAVLLLSTYEQGHQPLGLASPLAFLERAGYRPAALDLAVERLDEEAVRRARFVGLSVPMHTAMRLALAVAARVRALKPSVHICFYGLYAPLNRDLLCAHDEAGRSRADSVIGGEYEGALLDAIEALGRGDSPSPPRQPLVRLPFAAPSRDALRPLARYAGLIRADGTRVPAGDTEASRGCKHRCRHCPVPAVYEGRFFVVPVEVVLADVRRLVEAGAQHVTLGDPDFLNGPGHALQVARAIHREFPSLGFDVTAKIEHLLAWRERLPELASLGCLFVTAAVESLSDEVLAVLDKGHTRADVEEALEVTRAAGLLLRPTWVPFTPWSTLEDHLALFEFLEAKRLLSTVDPVQLTLRLLLPPGSLLLARPEMRPHLDGGGLDAASLSYRWTHPDARMDTLQRESAARVAVANDEGRPALETYFELKSLAHATAGRPPPERPRFPTEGAPRLSESWFC